jgi:hypothetical protein
MNPEKHLLDGIEWQFFCTWTLKTLKEREAVLLKSYFAMMREQADNFGVHFKKTMWVLRKEKGEQTGRPHFHSLIAGFPASALGPATCFSFMKIWERRGNGMARVRIYNSALTGVGYVLKGVDEAFTNAGANWYELGKFGIGCDVMLSMSLIRHMENRRRFGHRDRDGLFCERLGYHARQRAKLGDESRGTDTPGYTRQSGVTTVQDRIAQTFNRSNVNGITSCTMLAHADGV